MSHLPTARQVSSTLHDLLGRNVSTKDQKVKFAGNILWAHYATESGDSEAYWLWDLPAVIIIGSALTMVPVDQALRAVKAGQVDELTLDNFREVANILVSLLNEDSSSVLFLKEVGIEDGKKGEVATKAKAMARKLSFGVEVDGYGGGASELSRS